MKYSHVNLISHNWRTLADFYIKVFACREKLPERDLTGNWVDSLTGLPSARIQGIHLILPGYGDEGPTLEIFTYNRNKENQHKAINLEGFGHIAFSVEDVRETVEVLLAHGGTLLGEIIDTDIDGVGTITVAYTKDPEGNIIEIQKWS